MFLVTADGNHHHQQQQQTAINAINARLQFRSTVIQVPQAQGRPTGCTCPDILNIYYLSIYVSSSSSSMYIRNHHHHHHHHLCILGILYIVFNRHTRLSYRTSILLLKHIIAIIVRAKSSGKGVHSPPRELPSHGWASRVGWVHGSQTLPQVDMNKTGVNKGYL